jgi:hypothetical protein
MKILSIALVAALSLVSFSASAIDLGIAAGNFGSGAQSQVASQSVGGSQAALIGITGQQSSAVAGNQSFGASQLSNNDSAAQSGTIGFTQQQGTAGALGLAASANANVAQQVGLGQGLNNMQTVYLFVGP